MSAWRKLMQIFRVPRRKPDTESTHQQHAQELTEARKRLDDQRRRIHLYDELRVYRPDREGNESD